MAVRLTGGLFNDAGTARVGITAYAFAASLNADENTATGSAAGSDATDTSGEWDITGLAENLYDVRIDDGSTRRWRRANERVQLEMAELSNLLIRNPADTFTYDIVPAAIVANRTLNLPLTTQTATLAAIDHGIKGADISSVGAALVLVAGSDFADVTGTTTVTSISTRPAGSRFTFQFDDALILTHNATTLILQGGANLTTAAGDVLTFISEGGGNWREESRRLAAAAATGRATQAALEAETDEATYVSPNRVRNSPGVAKVWGRKTAAGLLESPSYNVLSITDTAVGVWDIVIDTDFSSSVYSAQTTLKDTTGLGQTLEFNTYAVGSIRLQAYTVAGASVDVAANFVMFGDQ